MRLSREGVALPAAMIGLLVIALLTTSAFVLVDLNRTATENREDASRALHLAEQAVAQVVAIERYAVPDTTYTRLLRGPDGTRNTADDGYLTGYGLASLLNLLGVAMDAQIPSAGRSISGTGTYFARLVDDPDDADGDPLTDTNGRIMAVCRGVTSDGAEANVNVILRSSLLPGLAVDGSLSISSASEVLGKCGNIHVNDDLSLGDNLKVTGYVTTSDDLNTGGKTIRHQDGSDAPRMWDQDTIEVPLINPWDYCGPANYILQSNGFVLRRSDNTLHNATGSGKFGWKRSGTSPVVWESDGTHVTGTFCAEGNVKFSASVGTALTPLAMSIIATGAVQVSGSSYLRSAHPDDIFILSGGDIELNGSTSMLTTQFSGSIYARSQCKLNGTNNIRGQLICKNEPSPSGTMDYAGSTNVISGQTKITFGCGGFLGRRGRIVAWYPTIGS